MPDSLIDIPMPVGGVNRRFGFESQPAGTTRYANNIWPRPVQTGTSTGAETTTLLARLQRRPVLSKLFGATWTSPTNHITMMTVVDDDLVFAHNGRLYYDASGTPTASTGNPRAGTSVHNQQSAELNSALFVPTTEVLRVNGTDGTISMSGGYPVLDAASVTGWTTKGIDTGTDIVVVTSGTGTVHNGTYTIAAIDATNGLSLTPADSMTGNCTYRVIRGGLFYHHDTHVTSLWAEGQYSDLSHKGIVPYNCDLICRYNGRIVMAGDGTSATYFSRQGDAQDWDYGASDLDPTRAFVLGAADFGVNARPTTALMPYHDDYLVIANAEQLWLLRGDPGVNGVLGILDANVGVCVKGAWCQGAGGTLYFIAKQGLYELKPGGSPVNISVGALPGALQSLDTGGLYPVLQYDPANNMLLVFVAYYAAYWVDLTNYSWWPMTCPTGFDIYSACNYNDSTGYASAIAIGCGDGYMRRYSANTSTSSAATDDGTAITSELVIGPIEIGKSRSYESVLDGVAAFLGGTSTTNPQTINYKIYVGESAEAAYKLYQTGSGYVASGSFNAYPPPQTSIFPRVRGCWVLIDLYTSDGLYWELEKLTLDVSSGGRWRP